MILAAGHTVVLLISATSSLDGSILSPMSRQEITGTRSSLALLIRSSFDDSVPIVSTI